MFRDFERDAEKMGVMFHDFVTAVAIYTYTNEGDRTVTIADIATAFNTTPDLAREAVGDHPWLVSHHNDDPTKQTVESDGE